MLRQDFTNGKKEPFKEAGLYALAVFLTLLSLAAWIRPLTATSLDSAGGQQGRLEDVVRSVIGLDKGNIVGPRKDLPPLEPLDSLKRTTLRTRSGDTLSGFFTKLGLAKTERDLWIHAVKKHFAVRRLQPGQEIHFYFTRDEKTAPGKDAGETLKALEIELDEDWILTWEKGDKEIVFDKRERPYEVELKTAAGVIERSLAEAGLRIGLHRNLISQLADIFSWEIDLNRDIRHGDSFKVLYGKKSRKGKDADPQYKILAAETVVQEQKYVAIYFEKERGKSGYYDLDGRSLARAFLRFPLEFASITSHFAHSRFHPILKVDRPHYGVDFSAQRGTPVRAVGNGKIVFAGWKKGGYGRMIEVRHDSTFTTRYAHLQAIAKGIKRGAAVAKGQIIGYVGSSGKTTGAHLHFELYKDDQYVDPLTFEFPPEDKIEQALRRLFDNAKQLFLAELDATPHS